jgi:hypothetical protein
MRSARINLQRGALNELGRQQSRVCNRHNLVVIAVKNKRWYVELFQISGENQSRKMP